LQIFVNNIQYGEPMEIEIQIIDKLKDIIKNLKEIGLYKEEKLNEIKDMVMNDLILEDIIDVLNVDN
jgi:hypothetical protein